jgi:hypothetical protein
VHCRSKSPTGSVKPSTRMITGIPSGGYPLDSASPYRLWCLTYGPDHRLVGFRCRIDGLSRKKSLPRLLDFRRLKRKVNSSR